jgi:Rrf2 family protein
MTANTRVATAVQILCVMAHRGDPITSETIAGSLRTNPVVARRMLKSLEAAGFVSLRPGRDGGVHLTVPAAEITLDRVYRAVEGDGAIFALRQDGSPRCPVNRNMKRLLTPVFNQVSESVSATLGKTTIADLVAAI